MARQWLVLDFRVFKLNPLRDGPMKVSGEN